jgi:hypothetical protein
MELLKSLPITKGSGVGIPMSLVSVFKTNLLVKHEGFETPLVAKEGESFMPIQLWVFGVTHIELWIDDNKQRILKVFWNAAS